MDLFSAGMGLFFASQSCFAAGTKLLAKGSWGQGWREIELITTDDLVASRDENNPGGAIEWKTVEELFQRTAGVITLTVNGREIRTTSEHPFYHAEKGWLPAGDLVAGDRLVGQYGEVVIVNKVEAGGEYEAVYNLRVADWHTYFVGDEGWGFGVWAHNSYGDDLASMNIKGWKKGKGSATSHAEHAAEMGFKTTAEYTNAAKAFAGAKGPGFTTGKIGNTFFKFDHSTNRILIVNGKDRVIKTFYKAYNGVQSFKEAMQQHLRVLRAQGGNI